MAYEGEAANESAILKICGRFLENETRVSALSIESSTLCALAKPSNSQYVTYLMTLIF